MCSPCFRLHTCLFAIRNFTSSNWIRVVVIYAFYFYFILFFFFALNISFSVCPILKNKNFILTPPNYFVLFFEKFLPSLSSLSFFDFSIDKKSRSLRFKYYYFRKGCKSNQPIKFFHLFLMVKLTFFSFPSLIAY